MAGARKDEQLTDEEIAKRRDEGLRRLLKMPPKPHAEITGRGKRKRKPKAKKEKTPAK